MAEAHKRSFQVGLFIAAVAFVHACAMHFFLEGGPLSASLPSILGAMAAGTILWQQFVVKKKNFSLLRGGTIGFVTGWLSLYFGFVGYFGIGLLQEEPFSIDTLFLWAQSLIYSFAMPIFVVPLFGWAVLVLCTIVGVYFARIQRKR